MSSASKPRRKFRWARIGLVGLISLFAALEIGFRLVPQAIPRGACRFSLTLAHAFCDYQYQYDHPLRLGFIYKPHYGYSGPWNPANPDMIDEANEYCGTWPDQTFHYTFRTDDKGFVNNTTPWAAHYDIVVTGDSFTRPYAPVWWMDVLREQTGMSVLNLGMEGWATQSEAQAVRLYGLDKHPQWVVMLYFEGNDLFGVGEYQRRVESGMDWRTYQLHLVNPVNRLIMPHMLWYWADELHQVFYPKKAICRYPMTVATNVNRFKTVFYDVHISQLSFSREQIAATQEWKLATQTILDLRDAVTAQGGRFLLVYVPSKEHLYWARIWDTQDIGHFLELTTPLRTYQEFTEYVEAQMQIMDEFAASHQLDYLNLTGELWLHTMSEGKEYYNYADMHWNEAGNRLVGEMVAHYLMSAK